MINRNYKKAELTFLVYLSWHQHCFQTKPHLKYQSTKLQTKVLLISALTELDPTQLILLSIYAKMIPCHPKNLSEHFNINEHILAGTLLPIKNWKLITLKYHFDVFENWKNVSIWQPELWTLDKAFLEVFQYWVPNGNTWINWFLVHRGFNTSYWAP